MAGLYKSINNFKNIYQTRINIVEAVKDDMVTDSHSILFRWKNHFSQLINVHEIHEVEPLIP